MGKSIIAFKIAQEPTSTAKNSTVTSKMILPWKNISHVFTHFPTECQIGKLQSSTEKS